MITSIYALYDPRIPDLPFYVGKGQEKRAQQHWKIFQRKGTAVNVLLRQWFESLKQVGIEPTWQFLEENVSNWQDAEKEWIAATRRVNGQLCNVADGGNQFRIDPEKETEFRRKAGAIGGRIGGKIVGKILHQEKDAEGKSIYARRIGRLGALSLHSKRSIAEEKEWSLKMNQVATEKRVAEGWIPIIRVRVNEVVKGSNGREMLHATKNSAGKSVHARSMGCATMSEKDADGKSVNARKAMHLRWHVRRGVVNSNCRLCSLNERA